ncbi:MAG: chorismate mutase AroQ, gamma subclass [Gammaproteobacteria bacterium]|nr:chorismate mutase AroQ, gamma subclass [Gammaproteobacteria bacterium]RPG23765.1 MAG: gamma subclass chorismate mutase AroQ [Gammaproteobacteria bacterium TMED50]
MSSPHSSCPHSGRSRWLLLFLSLLIGDVSLASADREEPRGLVEARLLLMKDVARYKWHHQRPIEDLARERVVLKHARSDALRHGLDVDSYAAFMNAQINAAKVIQQYWFRHWQRGHAPTVGPDLTTELRPELITLGERIAQSLSAPDRDRSPAMTSIKVVGLDRSTMENLITALSSVQIYAHRLDQVLSSQTLRIGTTGDYAPFSFAADALSTESQTFQGIDIDLARDLARSLNVQPVFIKTSWPTLMDDLKNGHFDVGMSGVSRTISRSHVAFFSQPYHRGGKTPIARCTDRERFSSLTAIDQPGVRVIVNPGGTNERFTRQLTQASIRVFGDNTTIFDEIIEDRADVMFTDLIEVRLQTSRQPTLCSTMSAPLTYQEKAILMTQDLRLKEVVSIWLDQRLGDGTVQSLFDRHMNTSERP